MTYTTEILDLNASTETTPDPLEMMDIIMTLGVELH